MFNLDNLSTKDKMKGQNGWFQHVYGFSQDAKLASTVFIKLMLIHHTFSWRVTSPLLYIHAAISSSVTVLVTFTTRCVTTFLLIADLTAAR